MNYSCKSNEESSEGWYECGDSGSGSAQKRNSLWRLSIRLHVVVLFPHALRCGHTSLNDGVRRVAMLNLEEETRDRKGRGDEEITQKS